MSKLDRLNARVAKLLTVAVHEVLEVVKETVSEYQDKTARTQRENESLKRKLQDLQDQLKRESSAATVVSHPVSGGRSIVDRQPEQSWSPKVRQEDPEPTAHTVKSDLAQEHSLVLRLEHTDSEFPFPELPSVYPEDMPQPAEDDASYHMTHTLKNDIDTDSGTVTSYHTTHALKNDIETDSGTLTTTPSDAQHTTVSSQLNNQLNFTVIKTEPESTEYMAVPELPAILPSYDCVDLSCNSTRQDGVAVSPKSRVGATTASPYGLVLLHSNHNAASKRFAFTKNSRAALDVRKHRQQQQQQHFRRDEPHICFVCGKTFSRVGNLRIHQRCHTGEKPYGCLQCGRSFRQAGDLKKHKRVHTGEKPYYCSQCGKSFSRGENLKRHQKIHVGETLHMQQVWREHHAV